MVKVCKILKAMLTLDFYRPSLAALEPEVLGET